jgi:hypothetical protein
MRAFSIDSYRFLDFASRQVMKAWAARERPETVPFTPLPTPLADSTVALVSTAGIARHDDRPFDLDPTVLVAETAPAIAREMRADGVDAAALVPGAADDDVRAGGVCGAAVRVAGVAGTGSKRVAGCPAAADRRPRDQEAMAARQPLYGPHP